MVNFVLNETVECVTFTYLCHSLGAGRLIIGNFGNVKLCIRSIVENKTGGKRAVPVAIVDGMPKLRLKPVVSSLYIFYACLHIWMCKINASIENRDLYWC